MKPMASLSSPLDSHPPRHHDKKSNSNRNGNDNDDDSDSDTFMVTKVVRNNFKKVLSRTPSKESLLINKSPNANSPSPFKGHSPDDTVCASLYEAYASLSDPYLIHCTYLLLLYLLLPHLTCSL